ncbi:MAG: LptF/LptG family permease [Chitinophagaceae bacterium]
MLSKIDWYILRNFFVTFIFCMLLFTVIAVAVDSSEKTDDFVKAGLNTRQIISEYYIGFIPYIWGLLYPLFVFIAVIFFTSRMALRCEVIAILASGTTYNRWLRPYLIGGILFAFGLWLASRFVIPRANEIRTNFETKYDSYDPTKAYSSSAYYMRSDSNTYVGLKYYDTATKIAGNFFLNRLKNDKLVYNLRAGNMQWDNTKKLWRLTNVTERSVDSTNETVRYTDSMHLDLHFKPDELRKDYYLKDKLNTLELVEFIKKEELRGTEGLNALKVERYRRTATPASVVLLTLIGAFVAGRKVRGGSGLHLAIGIIIAALFILSDRFSTVFSVKGNLPPLLAAWIPNVAFTLVAYYLYRKAPK